MAPGFVALAARPIEAAEFSARAYLNERLHNGTQKLVVFEVDVNANTVAVDKRETDNPSTEWAVRHPGQAGSPALVRHPLASASVQFFAGALGFHR